MTVIIPGDPMTPPPTPSPSASPLCSSPLANRPIYPSTSTHNQASTSRALPIPRRASQSQPRPLAQAQTPASTHGRRPSYGTPSPRSHPLLGSYPLSLIHSRMSHAHAPHSTNTGFSLYIKSVGQGRSCPPELKCPKPLDLPFGATYYDLEDVGQGQGGPSQTPWVGTVDLEEYYFDEYSVTPDGLGSRTSAMREPPMHPGYQVAPVGQLQIIVKSPLNAIKAFLVPYDLRSLPPGGRLLARERTYVQSVGSGIGAGTGAGSPTLDIKGKKKESLRYAYQLQFICLSDSDISRSGPKSPPTGTRRRESSTTRRTSFPPERERKQRGSFDVCENDSHSHGHNDDNDDQGEVRYYLSRSIRVVFTSTPLESDEQTRTERTNEIVPSSPSSGLGLGVGVGVGVRDPASSPKQRRRSSAGFQIAPSRTSINQDWDIVRRKWFARREKDRQARESVLEFESESAIEDSPPSSSRIQNQIPSLLSGDGHGEKAASGSRLPIPIDPAVSRADPVGSRTKNDVDESLPPIPIKPPIRTPTPAPIPQPFNIPHDETLSRPGSGSGSRPPQSPRSTKFRARQLRRTSTEERELSEKFRARQLRRTSTEERELSEKFRTMGLDQGGGSGAGAGV